VPIDKEYDSLKIQILSEKIKQKRAGCMAQMVEHLFSKDEALSSNFSTTKNQNKIKKKYRFGLRA
jgi:hypothetical protein